MTVSHSEKCGRLSLADCFWLGVRHSWFSRVVLLIALLFCLLTIFRIRSGSQDLYFSLSSLAIVLGMTVASCRKNSQLLQRELESHKSDIAKLLSDLQHLVNSIDGIVWEGDPETLRFTFVSQQAEQILGYPPDEWLNDPEFWTRHMHPEDREWAVDFCISATREGKSHDFEYRMIAKDGRTVWLKDNVTVLRNPDGSMSSRGIMVDITKQKESESQLSSMNSRLKELNEMKKRFMENISHELRTPLSVVIGGLENLSNTLYGPLNIKQHNLLKTLERNTLRLRHLVDNLLTISQLESSGLSFIKHPVDLCKIIEHSLESFSELVARRGLEIVSECNCEGISLKGSEESLEQVLTNLLDNASRYARKTILVSCNVEDNNAIIRVSDDGPGVDPEMTKTIFTRFHSSNRSLETKNLGLGLSIVEHNVDQHGGRVGVKKCPRLGGALFEIVLPLEGDC